MKHKQGVCLNKSRNERKCLRFWSWPSKYEVSVGINKANFKGLWLHSSETLFSSSWSRSLRSGQTPFYFSGLFQRVYPPGSRRFSGSHLKPVALYGWSSVWVIFRCFVVSSRTADCCRQHGASARTHLRTVRRSVIRRDHNLAVPKNICSVLNLYR